MVDPHELEEGAPDRPCATCGHDGRLHLVREAEEPGRTIRETVCEACDVPCEFLPLPEEAERA